jgi:hypothetical protein
MVWSWSSFAIQSFFYHSKSWNYFQLIIGGRIIQKAIEFKNMIYKGKGKGYWNGLKSMRQWVYLNWKNMKCLVVKLMKINEAIGQFKLKEHEMFGCKMDHGWKSMRQWVYLNCNNTLMFGCDSWFISVVTRNHKCKFTS